MPLSLERNHRDDCNFGMTGLGINFQGSTFRGPSAEIPRKSPRAGSDHHDHDNTEVRSFSPHDFTREHVNGNDHHLIARSMVVMLTRNMLGQGWVTLNLVGISQNIHKAISSPSMHRRAQIQPLRCRCMVIHKFLLAMWGLRLRGLWI